MSMGRLSSLGLARLSLDFDDNLERILRKAEGCNDKALHGGLYSQVTSKYRKQATRGGYTGQGIMVDENERGFVCVLCLCTSVATRLARLDSSACPPSSSGLGFANIFIPHCFQVSPVKKY